jgi:hypothetical protein
LFLSYLSLVGGWSMTIFNGRDFCVDVSTTTIIEDTFEAFEDDIIMQSLFDLQPV